MTRSVTFILWLWLWLGALGVLGASADDGAYSSELARWQAKLAGNPKDIGALVALGKLCHNRGTLDVPDAADAVELARKYLGEALEIDPKHAFARALQLHNTNGAFAASDGEPIIEYLARYAAAAICAMAVFAVGVAEARNRIGAARDKSGWCNVV